MEKFIQIPIYLPKVDEMQLKKFLIDGLEEILQEHNIKTGFIENINSTIYPVANMSMFRTIRNIKRYLNLVQIFVPILKKEVFVDDLLYLLVIKVTSPALYDWIRMHPYILYQEDPKSFKENEEIDEFKKKYSEYGRIIVKLFPAMVPMSLVIIFVRKDKPTCRIVSFRFLIRFTFQSILCIQLLKTKYHKKNYNSFTRY